MKKMWLPLAVALFALVLFAPAALAQDDYDDDLDDGAASSATSSATAPATDDDGSASATASATATAAADDDDDDALPETGGPALLAPVVGALPIAGGVGSALALRRGRSDS